MAKLARLNPEHRDNLAAYLDGELEEVATQEIEQILAVSEVARHEVDMLSRTWDMLNSLPAHKASEEFTQKTVSSMRAAERTGPGLASQAVKQNARRGGVLTLWAAILVVCGYVGYSATHQWVPNDSEQLLDEYETISNLDKLQEVGSIEFLQVLKDKNTFAEHDEHTAK
jgi:anti-sigma factor RsiW